MKNDYKEIVVYIDKDNNVYSNPRSIDTSGLTSNTLNIWNVLIAPYDNETLERFLLDSLEKSFSREAHYHEVSPEEVLFKAKSWVQAVKGLKHVEVTWSPVDGGYIITPSKWNRSRGGYFGGVSGAYPEKPRQERYKYYDDLGMAPEKGAIAKAFLRAVELSSPATGIK